MIRLEDRVASKFQYRTWGYRSRRLKELVKPSFEIQSLDVLRVLFGMLPDVYFLAGGIMQLAVGLLG
jgi:hypothetical protein